jgi:hypothetical protein
VRLGLYLVTDWNELVPVDVVVPVITPGAFRSTFMELEKLLDVLITVRSWKSVKRYRNESSARKGVGVHGTGARNIGARIVLCTSSI